MEPVTPSEGWGVLHLFYKVDRARADAEPGGTKRVLDAIASLQADDHQVLVFTVLGHKAELGIMALGPDVARMQAFQHELAAAPLSLEWSYVSLTERSEYTDDEERARVGAVGRVVVVVGARRHEGRARRGLEIDEHHARGGGEGVGLGREV